MQYIMDCTDCDGYRQTPSESGARKAAREHTEETDHTAHVGGVYDAPSGAGYYRDGEQADLDRGERRKLDMERV